MIDWPKEISEVKKFAYNVSILVYICEEKLAILTFVEF